jgi:adenylate kinase
MDRSIILTFGLPGVGKTTLVKSFVSSNQGWIRLSGGDLISQGMQEADRDKVRDSTPEELFESQLKLVQNFQLKLPQIFQNILFDGHCLVKMADGGLYQIPVEIIKELSPTAILFIDGSAETILKRRANDAQRPNREQESAEEIDQRRKVSMEICHKYSKELGIPFTVLYEPTNEKFQAEILPTS